MVGTPGSLRVFIVRHGETRENVERIIQGQLDTDLNDKGRKQALLTGEFFSTMRIDRIIASPLRRAADTAKAILSCQEGSELALEYDDRLKERAFGVLEGKVYVGAAKKSEETEGIELMEPFSERLASFWNDLVTRVGDKNSPQGTRAVETVILVSHGAAISALMHQVLIPGRYCITMPSVEPCRFWNCSITEISVPVITVPTLQQRDLAGQLAHKSEWSIRPIHLGVQGVQFVFDHELQKRMLAQSLHSNGASCATRDLQERVEKTESEFERDPSGLSQLQDDTIKGPDGQTVEADIGYGKAIGAIVSWSNIDHLSRLEKDESITQNPRNGHRDKVNVDELVK